MAKAYTVKTLKITNDEGVKKYLQVESFFESRRLQEIKIYLLKNIDKIIEQQWGKFSKDFIIHHILKAHRLKLVRKDDEIVALAAGSSKVVNGRSILYLEFTVIHEKYTGYNLSTILNGEMVADEFIGGLFRRKLAPLDIVTITRNLRVVGSLSKYASYIYPDPAQYEKQGALSPAKDETWEIVNEILRTSWNPQRKLEREGCVLVGSYEDTPWLITRKTQGHYRKAIRDMFEQYLLLSKRSDREFIVHVKYNLISLFKYLLWSSGKRK